MRKIAAAVACVLVFSGLPALANADEICDGRFQELNDRFSAAQIALDNECYPEEALQSGLLICYPVSDECQEKYNTLYQEVDDAYQALYVDCDFPIAYPVMPGAEQSVAFASGSRGARAPRMTPQNFPSRKKMAKQIRQLKAKLRNAESRLRSSSKSCSKK